MVQITLFLGLSALLLAVSMYFITAYVRRSAVGVAPIDSNLSDIFLLSFIVVLALLLGSQAAKIGANLFGEGCPMSVFLPTVFLQMMVVLGVFVFQKLSSSKFMLFSIPTVRTALTAAKFGVISLVLVCISGFMVSAIIKLTTGSEPAPQDVLTIFLSIETLPAKVLAIFSIIVLAPISEELFFRGLVYRILKGEFSMLARGRKEIHMTDERVEFSSPSERRITLAAIGSALLFAFIHGNLYVFFPLFIMGLLLVACYEKSGNIFAPMLTHAFFNAANIGSALLLQALEYNI